MSNEVVSIVLGGGKGTRLYPLTKERSKPAVPFGGKYRLVDIPISNCINSNYLRTRFRWLEHLFSSRFNSPIFFSKYYSALFIF